MRKHLSVLGLAARGAVGRILLITVLTAALAGALLYLVPAQTPSQSTVYPDGEVVETYTPSDYCYLPSRTGATVVCAVGLAGCDGGAESQRLRLRDKDGSDHAAAAHRRGRGQPVVDGAERRVPAVLLGGDGGGDGAGIAAAHPEHRTGQRIIHARAADAAAGGVCQQLSAPI